MDGHLAWMYHVPAWYRQRANEGAGSSGTPVTGGSETLWVLGIESKPSGKTASILT